MKIEGETGEWEEVKYTCQDDPYHIIIGRFGMGTYPSKEFKVLKRIPEKSELFKWIDKSEWAFPFTDTANPCKESVADRRHAYEDGLRNGFHKAIQIAEDVLKDSNKDAKNQRDFLQCSGVSAIIAKLKQWAGIGIK